MRRLQSRRTRIHFSIILKQRRNRDGPTTPDVVSPKAALRALRPHQQ